MDYLGVHAKFNWDDIDVGNHSLDHSQNFFAQKHKDHEKYGEMAEIDCVNQRMASAGFEDKACDANENKENISVPATNLQTNQQIKTEVVTPSVNESINAGIVQECPQETQVPAIVVAPGDLDITLKQEKTKPLSNIAVEWSTQKPPLKRQAAVNCGETKTLGAKNARPPHAYEYKDVYQRKKEEALRARLEKERKMREFHSRPVPNYKAIHDQMEKRTVSHAVTCPLTPRVLKTSREAEEKRKKKLEELQLKEKPAKVGPRHADVLKEKPFVPQKPGRAVQVRPFNLHVEQRLQERKLFDAAVYRTLQEKRKQEEEERKKRDEEQVKELRKLATFKARPNPFNNNNNNKNNNNNNNM